MDVGTPPVKLAYDTYLDVVEASMSSLTDILDATAADVHVPSCPDWSLGELGAHIGDFAAFYTHAVCESTGATRPPWPNTWRAGGASELEGAAPAGYFAARAGFLLSLLRTTPPAARVRTWNRDDQTAHFVARRSAHEFAVHLVDAQIAAGAAEPIEADVAADGIEEVFMMLGVFKNRWRAGGGEPGGTLHLRGTDEARHWVVVMGPDTVEVWRDSGVADLMVSGTLSDLELLLYGRPTVGAVDLAGDAAVLEAWYGRFTF